MHEVSSRDRSDAETSGTRAVFFDRDGVLNAAIVRDGKPYPPVSVDELRIDVAAAAVVEGLHGRGFDVVVFTNQPDVARGTVSLAAVESIHRTLREQVAIDAFYVCYHDDADACDCRKPSPGMLRSASAERGIDLSRSYVVGDRWRDIEAGRRAGCRTVWIDREYAEKPADAPACRVGSLLEAYEWIVNDSQ
jgi:D-glycero-D-manno-heptose 1,7-bisphosphate phosphatase